MKRIVLLFTLLVSISNLSFSKNHLQEVVYLKNGSIIRGTIIEQIPNQTVKIQTADGSVFVYSMTEVEKFTKEPPVNHSSNGSGCRFISSEVSGYKGFVDLGYTIGTGEWGEGYFELNTSHGYLFNPYFYAGAGLGFHWYPDAEATLMPLFIDLRTQLSNRKTVPFIDLRIGYSFDLSNSLEGQGFYFAPSAGVQFFSNKKAQLILSLGYSLQKLKLRGYYYDSWGYGHLVGDLGHVSSNGFSLKVGVAF